MKKILLVMMLLSANAKGQSMEKINNLSKTIDKHLKHDEMLRNEYRKCVDERGKMYQIIRELDVTGKYNDTSWASDSMSMSYQVNPYKYSK